MLAPTSMNNPLPGSNANAAKSGSYGRTEQCLDFATGLGRHANLGGGS